MTITQSPSDEAAQRITNQVNAGTTYALDAPAQYTRQQIDPLEQIQSTRVDVVIDKETQETLDDSDNVSVSLRVWIRSPLPQDNAQAIATLNFLKRQIFFQLNNWNSADRRVQVWECDLDDIEVPIKQQLLQCGLYVAAIVLRAEVQR